jgi:glycosyltransferase
MVLPQNILPAMAYAAWWTGTSYSNTKKLFQNRLMKISIITVCFNSVKTIEETFKSIGNQEYKNIEYIVIDGQSTDGTLELIKANQHLINKWVSEPDSGLYDAMNKGIAMATGDVIGILNSDDQYFDNSVLSSVAKVFSEINPDCLYGDLLYVSANNSAKVIRHWIAGQGKAKSFYYGWMLPHPTLFVTPEIYKRCGVFNTNFPFGAVYEFMLRIMVNTNFSAFYLQKVLIKMRQGGESNKSLSNRKKSYHENIHSWKINGLKPYFFTIWFKILRKLVQFRLQF